MLRRAFAWPSLFVKWIIFTVALAAIVGAGPEDEKSSSGSDGDARTWTCPILPNESLTTVDEVSGAKVLFVTTSEATDLNLYFHQRSWLSDGSMLLFRSDRTGRMEIFGYVEATGELAQLVPADEPTPTDVTASISGNRIYLLKRSAVFEWTVTVDTSRSTTVTVTERPICDLASRGKPGGGAELTESCDGKWLAVRVARHDGTGDDIVLIDKANGEASTAVSLPYQISHLQFSRTQPNLVMYARRYKSDFAPTKPQKPGQPVPRQSRMWLANVETHVTWPLHWQDPGELNTHEAWWVDDQITFCGGYLEGHSPVRVIDLRTGVMRVIAEGSWWEGATPSELAKVNWWHACGDYQGRWVAADNWHGVIALFDARTTKRYILTQGHRTYGHGKHPHVGWDHRGGRVVFTSNKRGNPDVCIAYIPEAWSK